jgi:hypothetical protein
MEKPSLTKVGEGFFSRFFGRTAVARTQDFDVARPKSLKLAATVPFSIQYAGHPTALYRSPRFTQPSAFNVGDAARRGWTSCRCSISAAGVLSRCAVELAQGNSFPPRANSSIACRASASRGGVSGVEMIANSPISCTLASKNRSAQGLRRRYAVGVPKFRSLI